MEEIFKFLSFYRLSYVRIYSIHISLWLIPSDKFCVFHILCHQWQKYHLAKIYREIIDNKKKLLTFWRRNEWSRVKKVWFSKVSKVCKWISCFITFQGLGTRRTNDYLLSDSSTCCLRHIEIITIFTFPSNWSNSFQLAIFYSGYLSLVSSITYVKGS